MPRNDLKKLLLIPLALLALWLAARYLLPTAMPFLLALVMAFAAEPLVGFFQNRANMPRGAATALGMTIAMGILLLILMVLAAFLIREVQLLVQRIPGLEGTALDGMASLEDWLLTLAGKAPESVRALLTHSVEDLFSDGTQILDGAVGKLLSLASGIVTRLPDSALGLGTWLLACYMFSVRLPKFRQWAAARVPAAWRETWVPRLKLLKKALFGWLMAQGKLMTVTFSILTVSFFLLRIPYAPLWALLISLVDALPVLGTGTVLIPWSLICFLQGQTARAIGLAGTYATAVLVRSALEPRLVGKHLGLDPLVTLLAMYAGYRIWGIGGMILAPLLAMAVSQFLKVPKDG